MKPTTSSKKVVIVDDHTVARDGLVFLLQSYGGYETCAQARTVKAAMEAIEIHRPDIVITDITLPDKNGMELIRDVLALYPDTLILVLSMHDESLYAERVLRAGAKGYVMKDSSSEELLHALDRAVAGDVYVSSRMASLLIGRLSAGRREVRGKDSVLHVLSDRELQVLELLGEALSNQVIAGRLHISPRTVDAHKTHIKDKLKISDNNALLKFAVQWQQEAVSANTGK